MIYNRLLPKLSQNLLEILNDEEYYDITIEVGNDPYIKIFRAHMVILHYRSPYLQDILSANKKKPDGTLVHIKLPNISPETFQIILRYIYGGKLTLKECDTSEIIEILTAAKELGLQELINYIQSFLIENKTDWIEQNFNIVYQASFENDSFLELQNYCTNLISKESNKIFKSLNFSSISEKLLISLIKNNNHQISEIQVWESAIKWGLAQHPELSSDPTDLSKEDFITLRDTLQQFIPLIEFYSLTPKEFSDKVLPYRKVLPKDLYKDLLKKFLDISDLNVKQSNKVMIKEISLKNVDSKIIKYQHVELISRWIDRLGVTKKLTSPYEFKLLFRGSRDGLTRGKFHEMCDGRPRTVTIVRVKDSSEILGGYNPIEWKSDNNYGITKDSFIFSLDYDKINNYILSRVKDDKSAIRNSIFHGPSFGDGDFTLFEFSLTTDNCSSRKNSYEKSIRKTEIGFSVEECEVFQIV